MYQRPAKPRQVYAIDGTAVELRLWSGSLAFKYPQQCFGMPSEREARLKREFAKLYPGLRPGVWYNAAWLSARQFAQTPCDGRAESMASVVDERHFEFRGGKPRRKRSLGKSA
jgi:hypothetical protein